MLEATTGFCTCQTKWCVQYLHPELWQPDTSFIPYCTIAAVSPDITVGDFAAHRFSDVARWLLCQLTFPAAQLVLRDFRRHC